MQTHELKILPKYFKDVENGTKRFELRKDDRGFEVGDWIRLRECDDNGYTGRVYFVRITYILRNVPEYGLNDGYCILGIER